MPLLFFNRQKHAVADVDVIWRVSQVLGAEAVNAAHTLFSSTLSHNTIVNF